MNAPAIGIGYSLWLRLRWVMAGMFVYMAVVAIAVQLSPYPQAALGALALSAVVAHLLTVFTLGPVDLGVRGSGFPKNMMVLPVRTRALVGWPMIYAATTMALLWVLLTTLILIPAGVRPPIVWPAVVAAVATAWLQAIGWSPFPSPFVRVPVLALALTPLSLLVTWAYMYLEGHHVSIAIVAASLAWMFVAYVFAIHGLARARSGSEGDWLRMFMALLAARIKESRRQARVSRPPFHSAFTAQLWHEFRRNAVTLPIMMSFVSLPMLAIVLPGTIDGDASRNLLFSSVTITPAMLGLGMLLGLFILLSGLYGAGMGKFDVWGKEEIPAFFAIRPMSTQQFVIAKMTGAGLGALAAWILLLVLVSIWAIVEASQLNPNQSLVRGALAQASARHRVAFVLIALGLFTMAWRDLVIGMWVTLTGRKWLPIAFGLLSMVLFAIACLVGHWLYHHREYIPQLQTYLPWLLGTLLLLKLALAGWMIRKLQRLGLASPEVIRNSLLTWMAVGVFLMALTACFVPVTPTLAIGICLAVPLVRIAAAPIALRWNRHR
jgi:hypothetical protein